MTSRRFVRGIALACASIVSAGLVSGCRGDRSQEPPREFFPSLDDQPRVNPQSEYAFFDDQRSARARMDGAVPFGRPYDSSPEARAALLRDDDRVYLGIDANGAWLERMPVDAVLRDGESFGDLIALGQVTFDIYCLPCHGGVGVGGQAAPYAGMVGAQWSTPIPNLHDPQYLPDGSRESEQWKDGYLFHTIRNGVANADGVLPALRMPGYAEVINEHEAWAVVAYLRVLQATRKGSYDDLGDAAQQRLDQQRTQIPAPTGAAPAEQPATNSMNSEDAS